MTLIYTTYYRSTESGNWQKDGQREREVTEEQFESMKANCGEIGMVYSKKYNEFRILSCDRLHATVITTVEQNIY